MNISTFLPFIGAALTGGVPALLGMAAKAVGGALGTNIEPTVDKITAAIAGATPEQQLALVAAENDFKLKAQAMGFQSEKDMAELQVRAIESVNKTMQTEAASDHWPTYSWRPFIGFMFGGYLASMWLLPLAHITPVVLSPDLTMAVGGILGIASWFRGKAQADPNVQTDNRG